MSTHRRRAAELGLSAISVEGALIAPAEIARIITAPADQKTANEYGCPKGTTLKDEIARYFRIGQAHWQAFARIEQPTIQQVAEFARAQLEEVFGFEQLQGPVDHERDGHRYRIAWEAKYGRVPVICAAPLGDEDAFRRPIPEFGDGPAGPLARRTPTGLLQEWLNANEEFLWGLVFAGDRVRLMRDNLSLTRPAWIEADVGAIYRDENFSEFTALWLLIHSSRFGAEGAAPGDSALERWREAGLRAGTAVRDRLRGSVEEALELLGQGFLDTNPGLRERLANGELQVTTWFEQLLRLVYRLIFLAVAEDRDLLHTPDAKPEAKALYADNYSFGWLRDRSARQSGRDRHQDAYEGIKIVFRALVGGERQLGLPSLGGLFGPGLTPDLDNASLENRAFLGAVFRLAWLMGRHGRERINWRDMATEEFGSVYEGLLELVPVIESGDTFAFAGGAEAKGNARKISGSYYTPDGLVQTLLDSALDPVLERAEAEGGVDAILNLKVIDPACGSGHFLLGAARRIANRIATLRDPDAPDYQHAMRDVVRGCIYGVDRNPLAVELAKVALWIEAIEPGKPLGYLDANIRCGDSLLGVFDLKSLEEGIPDEAYKPLTGDDKETANGLKKLNKLEREAKLLRLAIAPDKLASRFEHLHEMPESTVEEVRAKERAYRKIHGDPDWWSLRQACDAYVAAFLLPKRKPEESFIAPPVPTTRHVREALDRRPPQGPLAAAITEAVSEAQAFHWPVEFPDVMIARDGFDVVLGNPPWERIKLQEQEFFAHRAPEIAGAPNKSKRSEGIQAIAAAPEGSPARMLYEEFSRARRMAEAAMLFAQTSDDYRLNGETEANTYALFVERALGLNSRAGRVGLIVPTGLIVDARTKFLFQNLFSSERIESFFCFDNSKGIFPAIHRDTPFGLLTLGKSSAPTFCFEVQTMQEFGEPLRFFSFTQAQLERFNPNTLTAPTFRSNRDFELVDALYRRVPAFVIEASPQGNPWGASFLRMFDMATDSGLFVSAHDVSNKYIRRGLNYVDERSAEACYLPMFEGKMVGQYDHRAGTFAGMQQRPPRGGSLPSPAEELKSSSDFEVEPWYWIEQSLVARSRGVLNGKGWSFGYRFGTNPTNERTLIAAAIPLAATPHVFPQIGTRVNDDRLIAALYGNFNSLAADYVCRLKMARQGLDIFIVKQLPILPPHAYSEADLAFIVPRVLELSYTSESMQPLAHDLGYDGAPFAWDENRRALLRGELDAFYALAYGLTREELRYVLDPKEVMGTNYPSETFRVLQKNDIAKYGEYRTARLVLAAYDKMIHEGVRPHTVGWR